MLVMFVLECDLITYFCTLTEKPRVGEAGKKSAALKGNLCGCPQVCVRVRVCVYIQRENFPPLPPQKKNEKLVFEYLIFPFSFLVTEKVTVEEEEERDEEDNEDEKENEREKEELNIMRKN